jgi:hypothetical protein
VALEANDPLTATFQDYDWADEVLHARIGRDWYVSEFKTAQEASDFPSSAQHTPLVNYREVGYTEEHDWWPEFYRYACEVAGVPFDERAFVNHGAISRLKPRWKSPHHETVNQASLLALAN